MNIDAYLDEQYGIYEYLMKQKENGRIKHLGFSVHGSLEVTKRFLEAYGKDMEFCQVQLNYLDWSLQNAKAKVALLNEYKIPVWVMEPLRGVKLATLSAEHTTRLQMVRPDETIPAWAFRYLQSIPGVTMILSGMSNLAQLEQNIATFKEYKPLNQMEMGVLTKVAEEMLQKTSVPCTACRYCTSHCPKELDIPWLLELYNEHIFSEGGFIAPMALAAVSEDKKPQACIGCQSCEAVCPQQIKIAEAMHTFAEKL